MIPRLIQQLHKSGKLHNSWGIQESTQKDPVSPTEAEKRDPKSIKLFPRNLTKGQSSKIFIRYKSSQHPMPGMQSKILKYAKKQDTMSHRKEKKQPIQSDPEMIEMLE